RPRSQRTPLRVPRVRFHGLRLRGPDWGRLHRVLEGPSRISRLARRPSRGPRRGPALDDADGLEHARGVRRPERHDVGRVPGTRPPRLPRGAERDDRPAHGRRGEDVVRVRRESRPPAETAGPCEPRGRRLRPRLGAVDHDRGAGPSGSEHRPRPGNPGRLPRDESRRVRDRPSGRPDPGRANPLLNDPSDSTGPTTIWLATPLLRLWGRTAFSSLATCTAPRWAFGNS